jgi:tripartite-type tricarboxylate transporter receptor subunit TctC
MKLSRSLRAALVLLAIAGAATPAFAQSVVKLVVPFGPGAALDTVARSFNAELGKALGASVIVENRPGAVVPWGPPLWPRRPTTTRFC